ncbi:AMP-binding protein [Streptomyces sp. NBC_01198]|uniref:AMP-binding protein n=1 Tax=Streptomyces sp. NBC_01198 TaxID=2903769 RepID=UPI002E0DB40F|nr:AMP-binding protein [Streptomyces sp. NBC_01198]
MNGIIQAGPTLGGLTLDVLRRYPDRTAFTWDGGTLTYAGASDLVGRLQSVFAAHGLRRGHCMALLTGNRVESWCASIAAQASGMAITWLHQLASLEDHEYQLKDAEADALLVDTYRFSDRGGELAARVDRLSQVYTLSPREFGVDLVSAARNVGTASPWSIFEPGDVATINYTGGTTGHPKGAVRLNSPSPSLSYSDVLADFEIPMTPRYLAVAPMSHASGWKIMPTLMRGGSVHLLDGFSPDRVLSAINRERPNFTLLVPSMIYGLLEELDTQKADVSSLELLLYGAASISPDRLQEGIDRIGPVFAQMYGQTECYPITYLRRDDHDLNQPDRLRSCGRPVSTTAVALLDKDGHEVTDGEVGEICVRNRTAMRWYKNLPELTAETFRHGWLHTGDMGRMDERGYLYIVDRLKDMIITSGSNVFSRGVEDVLTDHAAVTQAVVFGTPDKKVGEVVNAAVILREGVEVDADELRRYVRDRKGELQAPQHIHFVKELPLTGLGKVDKQALRLRLTDKSSVWADGASSDAAS